MTYENEIITAVDEVETSVDIRDEVVETPKIIETKVVETLDAKPRDEFINLDNLKVFPDEINIF